MIHEIRNALAQTYTQPGITIWLKSPNRNLDGKKPIELIRRGQGERVLAEARRVAGGGSHERTRPTSSSRVEAPLTEERYLPLGTRTATLTEAERQRAHERHRAALAKADEEMVEALRAVQDPVTQAVLAHHARGTDDLDRPACEGCDEGAGAYDPPSWPCSTVEVLAKTHSIPVFDKTWTDYLD